MEKKTNLKINSSKKMPAESYKGCDRYIPKLVSSNMKLNSVQSNPSTPYEVALKSLLVDSIKPEIDYQNDTITYFEERNLSYRNTPSPSKNRRVFKMSSSPQRDTSYVIEPLCVDQIETTGDNFYTNLVSSNLKGLHCIGTKNFLYFFPSFKPEQQKHLVKTSTEASSVKFIAENCLVLGFQIGNVYCFDMEKSTTVKLTRQGDFTAFDQLANSIEKVDENAFLVGSSSGFVYLFDKRQRDKCMSVNCHYGDVCKVVFQGNNVFSGGEDGKVSCMDVRKLKGLFEYQHKAAVKAISVRGKYLASGGGDKDRTVKVFDVRTWNRQRLLEIDSQVTGLSWIDKEHLIVTKGYLENMIELYEISTKRRICRSKPFQRRILHLEVEGVRATTMTPNGQVAWWNFNESVYSAYGKCLSLR